MEFLSFFQEQFKEICRKYHLKAEKWGDRTYVLIGSNYVLLFEGELYTGMELWYIRRDTGGMLKEWNLDWYIGKATEDQDRYNLLQGKTILDDWKNDATILSRLLERRFQDLLSGGTEWMKDFRASQYYFEPRVVRDMDPVKKYF